MYRCVYIHTHLLDGPRTGRTARGTSRTTRATGRTGRATGHTGSATSPATLAAAVLECMEFVR